MPTCWIIAGPNGAGKTTLGLDYLTQLSEDINFINADLIAAGISPLFPERKLLTASRLFLSELEKCVVNRNDFAIETTLSGRYHLRLINRLRAESWRTILFYLALPSVEMSINRVMERVNCGGHNIPSRNIKRRFPRSLRMLLNKYSHLMDQCICYMNDEIEPKPVFVQHGNNRHIMGDYLFKILEKASK